MAGIMSIGAWCLVAWRSGEFEVTERPVHQTPDYQILFKRGEVVKENQSHALAFLGMKLRGEHVVAPDGGRERRGIVRLGCGQFRIARRDIVRVHKVDAGRLWQVTE